MQKKSSLLTAVFLTAFSLGANASVLTTTFSGGNSYNGNMFDVVNLGEQLNISAFDLNLDSGTGDIEVYIKNGSWVGFENDSAAWTLIDSASITSSGPNEASYFDVLDFTIDAYLTTAFYITTTGLSMNYTDGTAVGNIAAQNSDLQILEGAGKEYSFAGTFEPRVWNGTIHYEAVSAVPEPSTYALMLGGLGLVGFMARRRKQA